MKKITFGILLLSLILAIACGGDDNIVVPTDPAVQRAIDIEAIEEYLAEKGYSDEQVDTTLSGVRYVLLDSGMTQYDTLSIDESDIVSFDYIGKLTTDSLFDTSIEAVAEGTSIYEESRNYVPLTIAYSASGWTIDGLFVRGFSDGIITTFDDMHIGGHSLIIMPSDLGYGGSPPFGSDIPENAILIFELFPVKVRKQ